MNKILRIFVVLFTLLVSTGCSGNANAVKSYVDDKLKASGCEYKMGKVEVQDVQASQEDLVNGTKSAQFVRVYFSIKDKEGKSHDSSIGATILKGDKFDKSNLNHTNGIDVWVKIQAEDCMKKGN
jgi:hypothetical protein